MDQIKNATAILERAGIGPDLMGKWQALVFDLRSYYSAVVAFSGGVDSSFLAYAAAKVLGEQMVAVTVASTVETKEILAGAVQFAERYDIKHVIYHQDPLQNPQFQSNPPDRCYHCKTMILHDLWRYARENGYATVLEGQNADDESDYRPGRRAVEETGTFSPLAHTGLSKTEIRQLARAFGLSVWNQPSSPCLASRIPYGTAITPQALEQIDKAERYLHAHGFEVARVRYHQNLARIEVAPDQLPALLALREDLVPAFKQIGFLYVSLDLQGYRLGSLNEGVTR